jgi:hypothetical protein
VSEAWNCVYEIFQPLKPSIMKCLLTFIFVSIISSAFAQIFGSIKTDKTDNTTFNTTNPYLPVIYTYQTATYPWLNDFEGDDHFHSPIYTPYPYASLHIPSVKQNYNSTGWVSGSLTGINNSQIDSGFEFNYDYLAQTLFFKQKDSSKVSVADHQKVSYFSIKTDRMHYYVRTDEYAKDNKTDYFEILAIDPYKVSFFKLYRPGRNPSPISYYVFSNNALQEIKLSKKELLKIFSAQQDKIKNYLKGQSHRLVNEANVTGLINYLNS